MKKNSISSLYFLWLFGFILLAGLFFILTKSRGESVTSDVEYLLSLADHEPVSGRFVTQTGQTNTLKFELVNSQSSTSQGLSGRQDIGSDGMLFVFRNSGTPIFWMKDMIFDLDIVWLFDGKVVDLTAGAKAPAAGVSPDLLPTYFPSRPANMVLELPVGSIKHLHLSIADYLEILK